MDVNRLFAILVVIALAASIISNMLQIHSCLNS